MPAEEAPCVELGSAPDMQSDAGSATPSDISSASSPEPRIIRAPPLFRVLAMPPPDPVQPSGQDELERRLPGYRRIVIPREQTLIEILKQSSGAETDDEVLRIREVKLRVLAERVGLRRLSVLVPRLKSLTLDGSAISSLRDLGIGLVYLKFLSVNRCGLSSLDGIWGFSSLRELHLAGNKIRDVQPLVALQKLHTLDLSENPITESCPLWTLSICSSLSRLDLKRTPLSMDPNYRTRIASALPMLAYLDDCTLQNDVEDVDLNISDYDSSGSDSELEEGTQDVTATEKVLLAELEPQPCSSSTNVEPFEDIQKQLSLEDSIPKDEDDTTGKETKPLLLGRRRPATTECVGTREKIELPARPHTAKPSGSGAPKVSHLDYMSSLMDGEMGCGGSALTSGEAVCGNIAQALRRNTNKAKNSDIGPSKVEKDFENMTDYIARNLASEIPKSPLLEDWAKYKEATGIDIDLDFINKRPKNADPNKAIDRLEQIEKETRERLNGNSSKDDVEMDFAKFKAQYLGETHKKTEGNDSDPNEFNKAFDSWNKSEADPLGDSDELINDSVSNTSFP